MLVFVVLLLLLSFFFQYRIAFLSVSSGGARISVSIFFLIAGIVPLFRSIIQVSLAPSLIQEPELAFYYLSLYCQYLAGFFVFYVFYELSSRFKLLGYAFIAPLSFLRISTIPIFIPIRNLWRPIFGRRQYLFYLILAALILFTLVMFSSSGILWLISPRQAYIEGRAGLGMFWVLYCFSCSMLGFHSCVKTSHGVLTFSLTDALRLLLASVLSFLSGSKGVVLVTVLIGLLPFIWQLSELYLAKGLTKFCFAYFSRFWRLRQSRSTLLVGLSIFLALTTTIFSLTALSGTGILDYISEQSFFIVQLNSISQQQEAIVFPGYISLSGMLSIVPSIFRPQNFLYGDQILYDNLIPGQFELGNTPVFDPVFHALYNYGDKLVFLGGLFSAFKFNLVYMFFWSASRAKSFYRLNIFSDSRYIYLIAFGALPLVPTQITLLLYELMP